MFLLKEQFPGDAIRAQCSTFVEPAFVSSAAWAAPWSDRPSTRACQELGARLRPLCLNIKALQVAISAPVLDMARRADASNLPAERIYHVLV